MGGDLYRMIRDGAPESWTPLMRLVAGVIADAARDPRQGLPDDGGWPWSDIPIRGSRAKTGKWKDGLTERTGMSARAISRILTELARADYELREQIGTDKRGRPVFAYPGRAIRFRVPPLKPRDPPPDTATTSPPDTATTSPPDTATISSPDTATIPASARRPKVARNGTEGRQNRHGRPPNPASPILPGISQRDPTPHPQVVNSPLEGVRPATATRTTKIPRTDIPEAEWVCSGCGAKAADGVRFARPPDLCAECAAEAEAGP
jgi:hypothetical protein